MSQIEPFAMAAFGIGFSPTVAAFMGMAEVPPLISVLKLGGGGSGGKAPTSNKKQHVITNEDDEDVGHIARSDNDLLEFLTIFTLFRSIH
jgi:hypothetical protein